jgi:succinyl-diaminopimelate desuccinylase
VDPDRVPVDALSDFLKIFLPDAVEFLAIPSTEDRPEQLRRALEFVIDDVGSGFTVERFESNGKLSALIYRGPARRDFRVILNAHVDVVPADPELFRPRREGDRLYARGSQDMKISALAQARAFRTVATEVPYPLALQVVTDEEVGGKNGTKYQVDQGVTADFVIIGEHSGLDIVADSKGLFHVVLNATGAGAHSAYPWLGDNALVKLIDAVQRIMARYPVPTSEAWRTTVNVARIETPNDAFNQIPASAQASLDVRYPPEDADLNGKSVEEITAHFAGLCGPGITVSVDHLDPPHHADYDRAELTLLRQAAQGQGYAGAFLRKHGAGDGRFYYQRGIDAVAFGVGGAGQHGPDEYADLTTVEPYQRALTAFLLDLA